MVAHHQGGKKQGAMTRPSVSPSGLNSIAPGGWCRGVRLRALRNRLRLTKNDRCR
jgi:hypothetical protein